MPHKHTMLRFSMVDKAEIYDPSFYRMQMTGSRRSAERIVPIVMEIFRPRSVVDVGCGAGTWLSVFKELGAQKTIGLDGDHVDRRLLQIPESDFRPIDLSTGTAEGSERFDLAVSLEVAEHLEKAHADKFVHLLTRLSRVILFSAAIPGQGGVNHVNEQWPSYWIQKFEDLGYSIFDLIRRKVWQDREVEVWYKQNSFVMVANEIQDQFSELKGFQINSNDFWVNCVHPDLFLNHVARVRIRQEKLDRIIQILQS